MIVNVFNELYTKLKKELKNVNVVREYPSSVAKFPCVVVSYKGNSDYELTVDSGGVHHNNIDIEINIFSNTSTRYNDIATISNKIDDIFSGEYNFRRTFSGEIPNYADLTIYRFLMRYDFIISENNTVFRQ